jgi:hypothetical protein
MSISDLPNELLQLIIDIAVHQIGLQDAVELRETCRTSRTTVQPTSLLTCPRPIQCTRFEFCPSPAENHSPTKEVGRVFDIETYPF